MRTKTLLLAAAALSAGLFTASAQPVYSQNIVGYVNVTIPANQWAILSNPFKQSTADYCITNVLGNAGLLDSTLVYLYQGGTYGDGETYIDGYGWFPGTSTVAQGEGFFIGAPSAGAVTVTFVGEVATGVAQTNDIPAGAVLRGSQVPQALPLGDLTSSEATTLHFPAADSDNLFFWDITTQAYKDAVTYVDGYGWYNPAVEGGGPVEGPTPAVAEGFWVQKTASADWIRTFTP